MHYPENIIFNSMVLKNSDLYEMSDRRALESCNLCPRECYVDRFSGGMGTCATDSGFHIASVCIHKGEEPPISGEDGICNIFFEGCNLRCIHCQNHEISNWRSLKHSSGMELQHLLDRIEKILETGINAVGFVSPSHVVPQVKAIVKGLNQRGMKPITVYNTNGYDKVETLRSLEGLIDVYLPDFKYVTSSLSLEYSGAADYPEIALRALKEMYYQKGSVLRLAENGRAEYGMLIRHLVLPGHTDESIAVLKVIAGDLSPGVHISLMSQYHPAFKAVNHPDLNRPLNKKEYNAVVTAMQEMGFRNGWIQDMESFQTYRPDFKKDHPFEY
jgi:putative pyruvate formate lyase activating enzyme